MNSYQRSVALPPAHREQQTGDHESKCDRVVPRAEVAAKERNRADRAASWNTSSQTKPISIKPMKKTTNQMLDGPALTLTGVRLTGLMVKSFFLRTLDLGMGTFANSRRHTVRR